MKNIYQNIDFLGKALDALWIRNEVISNNIANSNTPGFKSSFVAFEELLKTEIDRNCLKAYITNERHIQIGRNEQSSIEPKIIKNKSTSYRNDGNNVDIDNEMAQLTKNAMKYNSVVQQLMKEFSILKSVINEGRR